MVRLAISVEGPTENEFCKEVVAPHLRSLGVDARAITVTTKQNITGPNYKGGAISLPRVINEVKPLLHSFDYVTTMYDFYAFKRKATDESADELCIRISDTLHNPRNFLPYLQVYEFEAILFANPDIVGQTMQSAALASEMKKIVNDCGGAEKIDDSPLTAPSKRLETIFKKELKFNYDKKFNGPLLALDIGLYSIRHACPRFNNWITNLEALAAS